MERTNLVAYWDDSSDSVVRYDNLAIGPVMTPISQDRISDLQLADLDGDGDLDLIGAYSEMWVFPAVGAVFAAPYTIGPSDPEGFAVGDTDGDGDLDVMLAHRPVGFEYAHVENLGGLAFGPTTMVDTGVGFDGLALADLDGDGMDDGEGKRQHVRGLCRHRAIAGRPLPEIRFGDRQLPLKPYPWVVSTKIRPSKISCKGAYCSYCLSL